MSKYADLLENRTALKAMKESMFKLGYSNDKLQLLTDKIKNRLLAEHSNTTFNILECSKGIEIKLK